MRYVVQNYDGVFCFVASVNLWQKCKQHYSHSRRWEVEQH